MMKKVLVLITFAIALSFLFSGSAQADPGPEGGNAQALTAYIESWTDLGVQDETETAPLPSADPGKKVYITFDDGPDPIWSPQVLAVLRKYNAHATFFMIGRNAASFPETIVQIASDGNTLANHSYNHYDLTTLEAGGLSLEIGDTDYYIRSALRNNPELEGQVTRCLRPPYGQANDFVYSYAGSMGYSISMWNLDTRDWAGTDPHLVLSDFISQLQPDRVVLMHDGGENRQNTIEALDLILHELIMQGYDIQPFCTANGQAVIGY